MFLSLERLEAQRTIEAPLQRIGLSATQRPLEEVARLLGGGVVDDAGLSSAAVEIVDAGSKRRLELSVQVPVEDMSRLGEPEELSSGPAAAAPRRASIWPSIHPRLLELIRAHRSTMIFANSRRLAERLAAALNELAGEEIALAHHGSVRGTAGLDRGPAQIRRFPAIVASRRSSWARMGAGTWSCNRSAAIGGVGDAAPRSRGALGRSVSRGVIFPKYRGDLLACAR